MANRRVGGVILLKIDGKIIQAVGEFSASVKKFERESMVGADSVHGFSEKPVAPFLEGAIRDNDELDITTIQNLRDATCTLELANGKVYVFRNCYSVGDSGNLASTDSGEITFRIEAIDAEEVR